MSSLSLRGVRKSFGPVLAVDGVDLDVPQRSVTAVLGPSGCGKTTLLRLVAGFLDPDAGTIAFGDRTVAGSVAGSGAGSGRPVPPQQRRVGYVPQEGALFPHLDVAANVAFGLPRAERRAQRSWASGGWASGGRVSVTAPRRDRVREVLDLVELPASYADRFPHELSGGQQQRVALARALAPNPSVVLLDEPFSSLDASLRAATGAAVVRALHAANATAVLVTHDQDEALSLADQVAVMRAGRMVQAASPREVYRTPTDPEVGTFVGGAMVLPAIVEDEVATTVLGELALASTCRAGTARVLVRPEALRIGEPGTATPAWVTEIAFYGHDAAVSLELVPGGEAVVARTNGLDAPEVGAAVGVSVAGRVLAFPTEFPTEFTE